MRQCVQVSVQCQLYTLAWGVGVLRSLLHEQFFRVPALCSWVMLLNLAMTSGHYIVAIYCCRIISMPGARMPVHGAPCHQPRSLPKAGPCRQGAARTAPHCPPRGQSSNDRAGSPPYCAARIGQWHSRHGARARAFAACSAQHDYPGTGRVHVAADSRRACAYSCTHMSTL